MLRPTIQLKFSQQLDQDLAWEFYTSPEFGGCNFWEERALPYHPRLLELTAVENPKNVLDEYISNYYNSHQKEMLIRSRKTSARLSRSQDDFFKVVDELFNFYPWPKEEFTAFFSIFDFCPRFLDQGSFQVFLYDDRDMQLYTIFHEMLHFIFYDFAKNTFPKVFGGLDTEKGTFWKLAEVFNAVIQSTDRFVKLHGRIEHSGYPDHKSLIIKGRKLWRNNQDVNQWIVEMMKIV